ncbi:PilZ domain-containing protein [Endozoicomonas sp. SM1973]|uniref:PilZ domain-containing protein n=1 Tax=Spartinivicinus marinus TaxID=2994442 RepID=A0A853IH26_9GAMM|nr:PilZ domain-containing protein [Spartinivicinus marinus]MCX4027331.1 PilZ domain-containing protein [Spartinivicinus marinus]NYZ68445.1 PilZ domain-containing protein [Spartinivicinus marinus]
MTDGHQRDDERRCLPRKRLKNCHIEVLSQQTGDILGKVFDINIKGFMLLSSNQVNPFEQYALSFVLPDGKQQGTLINFEAECMWCQGSNFSSDFGAGFEFKRIKKSHLPILKAFIDAF